MRMVLLICLFLILCGVIFSLPVYIAGNLILWVFKVSFHLTLLHSFAICLMTATIYNLFFKKGKVEIKVTYKDKEGK